VDKAKVLFGQSTVVLGSGLINITFFPPISVAG
jgi:hypothetical protein